MKKDTTVLIMCGGKGERLRPLTELVPKPLINIKGRPILGYLLEHLKKFKIHSIVIAVGFHAKKIIDFVSIAYPELNIKIVDSGDADIIQRIRDSATHMSGNFVLMYGDTLADVNLDSLENYHLSHSSSATMTLLPLKSQFGLVELDSFSNVLRFREKPTLDQWVNIGYFYFDRKVLKWMDGVNSFEEFLEDIGSQKKLRGFKHSGVHITVNTLRELEEAEENIHEFKI
jgi:NDP-sugar pyrophosphorylase family protein